MFLPKVIMLRKPVDPAAIKPYLMTTTLTAPYIYYTTLPNIQAEAQALLREANDLFEKQDVQAVTERYSKAVSLEQKSAHLWCNLGAILVAQGLVQEGVQALRKAIELEPQNAGSHYNLGTALLSHGILKEAREHLKQAYDIEKSSAPITNNYAVALMHATQFKEAEKLLQSLVEKDTTFDYAFHNLGVLAYDQNNFPQAVEWYHKALATNPQNYASHNDAACAYFLMNDLEQALTSLKTSLQHNNRYKMAYYNLGFIGHNQDLI